jgi:hypothetical protein
MSRIRLYVDEDAAQHAVVEGLRSHGIDVLTVLEAGSSGESDEEQLTFAAAQGRVIYTLNVADFCRLHTDFLAAGRHHSGIIVIPRQRYSVGEKIRRLLQLIDSLTAEEMSGRLEYA